MWAEEKPSSLTVTQGKWWSPGETQPVVSVDQEAARTLGAKLGDTLELSGAGRTFTAHIAALHRVEQMRVGAANEFVFNPSALTGLPATYYGGVRMKPADVGALERAAYQAFPTVTAIIASRAGVDGMRW